MKNNKIVKIIYPLIILIQISMWVGVSIIQSMTKTSAGVMHHIYFKRYEYSNILTSNKLNTLLISTLVLAVAFLAITFYVVKNKKGVFCILQTIITTIMAVILILVIKLPFFLNLLAYYYFIMVGATTFLIQLLWAMIVLIKSR